MRGREGVGGEWGGRTKYFLGAEIPTKHSLLFRGSAGVTTRVQQELATQILRVDLLGVD